MVKLLPGSGTIKARVLAIIAIPCIALLLVGAGVSAYLVNSGLQARQFAGDVRDSLGPAIEFIGAVQEERRLSTLRTVGMTGVTESDLAIQRDRVDQALAAMDTVVGSLAEQSTDELGRRFDEMADASSRLPSVRKEVDEFSADAQLVYEFYSDLIEKVGEGIRGIARSGTEAEIAFEQMIGYDLFRSAEAFARSHVLVERAIAQGLDQAEYHQLAHQMGTYHEIIERVVPRMTAAEQQQYEQLKDRWFWQTVVDGDNAVMAQGPGLHEVSFDLAVWERASQELGAGLLELYESHSSYAAQLGASSANGTLLTSLLSGLLILLVTVAAMVIAFRLSRKLIDRLSKLRAETLALSDEELPNVLERLRQGDRIDVEEQVPWLEYGDDEIGQVADAFNKAQRTAIAATVKEAETRKGVGSVFLNIAHRTQVIVHRQLKVLDQVERSEDDPDQLHLLFQLDHLATRSRRNAENLIILGGEQPGRQWRNPVSLREVVRSAISETEHYTRVQTGAVPDSLMDGSVVADLAHLMAELVDNATAFSPPQAHVKVNGNVVGRGVVLEIEDQGLGMEAQQLEKINKMLRKPPDFSVMALSTESRVGLFVVAQLATKHGIKVALRESIYGGTTAIVLIPNALVVQELTPHAEPAMLTLSSSTNGDAAAQFALPAGLADLGQESPADPTSFGAAWRTVTFDRPPVNGTAAKVDSSSTGPPTPNGSARPQNGAPQNGAPVNGAGVTNGAASDGRKQTQSGATPADDQPARSDPGDQHDQVKQASNPPTAARQTVILGDSDSGSDPSGKPPTQAANGKPPLPRRRRQENLAPQLVGASEETGDGERDASGDADRSRALMAAYQKGTLRGRETEISTNGRG